MKVLIADDDPTIREVVSHLVADAGYEVLSASGGAEALESIVREKPEIVLTDWMMPEIDGVELCRRIRAVGPGEPYVYVILVTVRGQREDVWRGFDAGADDYIVKPFDPQELLARIRVGRRIVQLESTLRKRNEDLEESLRTINKLKSLLPICMFCKKVRTDEDYWQQLEDYIHEQTGTDFSHGICPDCLKKYYPEYYRRQQEEKERRRRLANQMPPPPEE